MKENLIKNKLEISLKRLFGALSISIFVVVILFAPQVFAQDQALKSLRETGKAFAAVAKQASPAVVFIQVEKTVTAGPEGAGAMPFGDEFFRRFFGVPPGYQPPQQQQRRVVGQGSGFIISADGYILTNNHVVGDTDKVLVKLLDGRQFKAKTIGTDPHTDVAVIKIEAKNLPVLPLGNSDTLEVGEWVLAIGNPFGLSHTLTAGIVSAKGRTSLGITDFENFIQTDAAINPGNSGGPLINLAGQAIGMNTAIFSQSGGYMGIGFAIPINLAKNIRDQLVAHGSVSRGYLGIVIQDLTPDLAKTFGVKDAKGVLVAEVSQGSPADRAGLKQGDVIVEFNGKPVEKVGPFRNRVALVSPGTSANMTVVRNGKRQLLSVKIGKLPSEALAARRPLDVLEKLGFAVETLTKELAERFGYQGETGVVVTQVVSGSVAESAGIRPGALIKEVNRRPIHNVEEFDRALAQAGGKGTVLMLIKEGKGSRYIALNFNE